MAGDYHYDQKKAILDWQLPVIDASNTQGSLEFTMPGHPDDFYPINVSFYSPKTICGLQVGIIISFTCVCFCCHIYECFFLSILIIIYNDNKKRRYHGE